MLESIKRINQPKNKIMSPQEFYDQERKNGNTEDITSNSDPDYRESFYQNIFKLMEDYASLISDGFR